MSISIRRVWVKPTPVTRATFFLSLVLLNFALSQAAHVLDAYRLAQFDKGLCAFCCAPPRGVKPIDPSSSAEVVDRFSVLFAGSQALGSRRTLINHLGTTVKAPVQTGTASFLLAPLHCMQHLNSRSGPSLPSQALVTVRTTRRQPPQAVHRSNPIWCAKWWCSTSANSRRSWW
jgi:hypothetical protein